MEIVGIDDITSGDFTDALKGAWRWYARRIGTDYLIGVSGVLHLASPLAGRLPPAEMLDVSACYQMQPLIKTE